MTNKTRAAGLLYGPQAHHLDHLAILCSLMAIPLLITDDEIAALAQAYYPDLHIQTVDSIRLPEHLIQNYEILYSCLPRPMIDELLFFAQAMLRKKIHTIWCPHGNSDKGGLEALTSEEGALLYGPKMIDLLVQKGVLAKFKETVITGNFRYLYYRKHQAFYDRLVEKKISPHLKKGARTILYAPTWQDAEKSSSFFDACSALVDNLPDHYNLIIKLHPNLLLQDELKTEQILWKYEHQPRVLCLTDFSPVYPLLDIADLYLGDASSIGYDFLAFNKPMFFLNQNHQAPYLFRCGTEIAPEDYGNIYSILEDALPRDAQMFAHIRKETYAYTFGKQKSWDIVRGEIEALCKTLASDELNLF